jgi:hypothetical protein
MEALRSTRLDDVQEAKRDNSQAKDTYRAPRVVTLGTAVGLVQSYPAGYARETYGYYR